ncbi:hypothetical protein SSX86_016918 [Deinandra increscens subsp. villosa]|uniref:GRF-type domain-containing protein n=1 Tax=Deinandra increscens subsp. villosa TaxID=3103831 RepID=A0AAP0CYJ5_9ASTR
MAVCYCRREATIRTSWTELNPGRRFYSCALEGGDCGFFGRVDPPMCACSSEVILGLLRSKNVLEKEVKKLKGELKRKNATLKMMFVMLVCYLAVQVFY